jgi:hypothetical protein
MLHDGAHPLGVLSRAALDFRLRILQVQSGNEFNVALPHVHRGNAAVGGSHQHAP